MIASRAAGAAVVPLTVTDHAILMGERLAQRQGLPGLVGQFHVHFHGRIDLALLDEILHRLVARWPLLTARLTPRPRLGWVRTGQRTVPIREETLACASDAEVLRAVERLLAEPFDLAYESPFRVIVLHRPDGRDVLTVQFSHVLMDAHGLAVLVQCLFDPTSIPPAGTDQVIVDPAEEKLRAMPLAAVLRAIRSTIRSRRRARPIELPRRELPAAEPSAGRITLRWIDEATVAAIGKRLSRVPLAGLTLAAAASGLRTLSRYTPPPAGPHDVYEVPLAHNRRGRASRHAIFHNVSSRVILQARPSELGNWEALVRRLVSQLRQQIQENDIAGAWHVAKLVARVDSRAPWLVDLFFRRPRPRSLRVTSWGDLVEHGRPALGSTIDFAWGNTICLGVSMELITVGAQLLCVFMHSEDTLAREEAARFLDEWIEDMVTP